MGFQSAARIISFLFVIKTEPLACLHDVILPSFSRHVIGDDLPSVLLAALPRGEDPREPAFTAVSHQVEALLDLDDTPGLQLQMPWAIRRQRYLKALSNKWLGLLGNPSTCGQVFVKGLLVTACLLAPHAGL